MAGPYTVVSSYSTNQLVGGTRLVPVRVIAFETIPLGIYAEYRVDLSIIDPIAIDSIISVYAGEIERLAERHDVAGMAYVQDVNRAQQLVDFMEITIQSTSGNSTEAVLYPFTVLGQLDAGVTPVGYPGINDVVVRLDAIEAL